MVVCQDRIKRQGTLGREFRPGSIAIIWGLSKFIISPICFRLGKFRNSIYLNCLKDYNQFLDFSLCVSSKLHLGKKYQNAL